MQHRLIDGRRTLIIGAGIAAALLIAGYSLYAALPLLLGPSITATSTIQENGLVRLSGQTERVSFFTINGAEAVLDEKGGFSIERAYPPGYTVVTLRGQDRFGRVLTKTINLTVP